MTAQVENASGAETAADVRAREVEEQMTDDERFLLLVSVMGTNDRSPVPTRAG